MVSGRICDSADICNRSGGILSSCKRWTRGRSLVVCCLLDEIYISKTRYKRDIAQQCARSLGAFSEAAFGGNSAYLQLCSF